HHIQCRVPDSRTVTSFQIQRANAATGPTCTGVVSASYTTVGTVSPAGFQASFIDFDRTVGNSYCYRVRVADPVTGQENFSIVKLVTIGGGAGDTTKPISTATFMTPSSSGLANTLDNGDKL